MLWMSDACENISGWLPADFIDGRVHWGELIEPEHRAPVWNAVQAALVERRPFQVTYAIRRRDGKVRWLWEQGYALDSSPDGQMILEGLICDVTPHQRALAEIERGSEFNQRVASTVPGHVFVLDINSRRITYSNQDLNGLRLRSISGAATDDDNSVDLSFFSDRMTKEDIKRGQAWLKQCRSLKDGEVVEWRYKLREESAQWKWRWMSTTPFERDEQDEVKAVLCVVMDITEQQETSDRLRDSALRIQTIMDNASDGIFVCDKDLRFTAANPAGCKLLRMEHQHLLCVSLPEIFEPDKLGDRPLHALEVDGNSTMLTERKLRRGDGSWGVFELHGRLLEDESLVIVARDVTERRRELDRRLSLERKIAEAQRLATLGSISRGIAHDFNNLLATILGSAETLIEDASGDQRQSERLERIRLAASRASELTRQLLDAAGGGGHELANVDVGQIIREMPSLLYSVLGANVSLKYDVPRSVPNVRGDAGRLRQVVMNLVVNASEAIGERSGTIEISVRVVRPSESGPWFDPKQLSVNTDYVLIEVKDDGVGIDDHAQGRIFEPYFSTKGPGRGLGLAAVRGIVRQHSGDLGIQSELGKGTWCQVWLPVAAGEHKEALLSGWRKGWRGSGRVLLVDDEDAPRAALKELVEAIGFEVTDVSSGRAALDLLRQHASDYAAVMLDVSMPGMDGVATWRRIATNWCALPVLLMSGMSPPQLGRTPDGADIPAFLLKPFSMKQLREALQIATGQGHPNTEAH